VHLKSLTLKGFKSFASATTLRLEPGITCVVGPNGSGKSNVVDAISWVLGEQGAKALRGGKMEDVIFAGTSGRAPLGRAEVTLTVDNSDGALPIDYSEVSITRRMFRDGAGEYEINGTACRLLDIQELLSDSGIGRELHVVVGQGQLDSVLQSRPEDRRAYIEEAAGVLKHRKRKEKALRKLDAMQANLTRLTDLTGELRRQLKPLGRQAEIARRAQAVQSELRDARLRLAADDLVTLRGELAREEADEAVARARRLEVEEQLAVARAEQQRLEDALAQDAPRLSAAQDTWYRLSTLAERLRGTVGLAQERARHLADTGDTRTPGRDPDELEAEAEIVAEQEAELVEGVVEARQQLAEVLEERAEHEATLAAAERAHLAAVRALADRRAGLATLAGRAAALRSGVSANADEIERLSEALAEADARTQEAVEQLEAAREETGVDAEADDGLGERVAEASQAHEAARARVRELVAAERAAEQQRAHWRARVEALSVGLARRDGSGTLLGDGAPGGVLGAVSRLITVEPDARTAVAAALGELADAVAVDSPDAAVGALRQLRSVDAGRATLLVGHAEPGAGTAGPPPAGRWAADLVRAPAALAGSVRRFLSGVAVVDDLEAARTVVVAGFTAVTREGDLLAPERASGGSGTAASALDVQAAVDEAATARDGVEEELAGLRPALEGARAEETARLGGLTAAREARTAAERRASAAAAQLGRLEQTVRSARAEAERLRARRDAVEAKRSDALLALEAAERQLAVAEDEPVDDEPDTEVRDAAADALARARTVEVDARLALRTAEERARAIAGRAESLRRQASSERQARARATAARAARERGARIAGIVVSAGERACTAIAESLAAAAVERDAAAAEARRARTRPGRGAHRHGAAHRAAGEARRRRAPRRGAARAVAGPAGGAHRQGARRPRACRGRPGRRVRAARAGPGVGGRDGGVRGRPRTWGGRRGTPPMPFDRATQQRRAARAEKDLGLLGRVNPLALEEFAALEERYRFLSTQLEDLKNTRRDLLTVVREVDDKILAVFTEAYTDVAREFETVFATLFPGGEGRLVLTDPSDMLTTGIEVEARPPGKKVKRLSLLSGGERSLTAMALLVAIFRARPSPFYVLDEIEAALDDVNLRRLILLMEELRATSQLIVITHQKATMEVADALYGVAMRGDGITTVISQRLRTVEPAAS
jgi:chromosome segregation protein